MATAEDVRRATGEFDLGNVHTLVLCDLGGAAGPEQPQDGALALGGGVAQCVHCEELVLRRCGLQSLSGLAPLVFLQAVDLSENAIVDPTPLAALPHLSAIRLEGNRICDLAWVVSVVERLSDRLTRLDLQRVDGSLPNPVCTEPGYRERVLAAGAGLAVLDGQRLHRRAAEFYDASRSAQQPSSHGGPSLQELEEEVAGLVAAGASGAGLDPHGPDPTGIPESTAFHREATECRAALEAALSAAGVEPRRDDGLAGAFVTSPSNCKP